MVAGCGAKLSKMILFIFNFILWLVGIALIALGGYVLARPGTFGEFFGSDADLLTITCGVVIGVGCFVFFLAFAGCFGAMKESACLLKIYIAVLALLVLLEIIGGILALVFRGSIKDSISTFWLDQVKTVKETDWDGDAKNPDFIDNVQRLFECCGAVDYTDYKLSAFQNTTENLDANKYAPTSCCKEYGETCGKGKGTYGEADWDIADKSELWKEGAGCTNAVVAFFEDNFLIIGAVALSLVAVEIVAMIFACCVISGISSGEYE